MITLSPMNRRSVLALGFGLLFSASTFAADAPAGDAALKEKVGAAIDKGLAFLQKAQKPDGSWTSGEYPGLTGLIVQSFLTAPGGKHKADEATQKGLAFIRKNAKPDGGIYADRMGNYNTSVCLSTLLIAADAQDTKVIDAAQRFVVGAQTKNSANPAGDGGFGYEAGGPGKQTRPDLDNTVFAMEALRLYREAQKGKEPASGTDLNWQAALDFVSRCQQLPETN
jgi:squalene-hopene/tetraprenyl-beta-curcumene cyclase